MDANLKKNKTKVICANSKFELIPWEMLCEFRVGRKRNVTLEDIHTYRHVNIELEFCETEFAIFKCEICDKADFATKQRMSGVKIFVHN